MKNSSSLFPYKSWLIKSKLFLIRNVINSHW
jgi:hypothetical protein